VPNHLVRRVGGQGVEGEQLAHYPLVITASEGIRRFQATGWFVEELVDEGAGESF
jgi:hypothetical protein